MAPDHHHGPEHTLQGSGADGQAGVDHSGTPELAHLQARLDEFELRLAALELTLGVGEQQAAIARHVGHPHPARGRHLETLALAGTPPLLLMLAHYLIMAVFGHLSSRHMLVAAVAIPLPFGFLVAARGLGRLQSWILGSIFVGLAAALGMNGVSALMHGDDVLPRTPQEAWDSATYMASITLSFAAGLIIGLVFWQYVTRREVAPGRTRWQYRLARYLVGPHLDARHAHRAAVELLRVVRVLAAFAAIAGSIYSGWLRFRY